MGFLNLKAWQSVGGHVRAERRSGLVQTPPTRYYYEQLPIFQTMLDTYFDVIGHRPRSIEDLYFWVLENEAKPVDNARAAELADWISCFEVDANSLLAFVNVDGDRAPVARRLYAAWGAASLAGVET
jgi:hypothetical protein